MINILWNAPNIIEDILTIDRIISKAKTKQTISKGYKLHENDKYIILAFEKINDKLYKNFLIIPKYCIIDIINTETKGEKD